MSASASHQRLGAKAAFAAAAFALAVAMLGTTLPTPLYGLYQQRFGFSELMVTVIFAAYAAGVIASLVLFGRLSDQIGRRRMLLPGLVLSAGIFTGTATATLVDLAPPGGRGRATLVAAMANMGALGTGPLLAGLLSQWAGSPLRTAFWVDLALLVPAAIGIWAMPEPVVRASHPRLRPQALKVPSEMRSTFILSAISGFAALPSSVCSQPSLPPFSGTSSE
jgi:MFS family permease